jgi:hypothetical protein
MLVKHRFATGFSFSTGKWPGGSIFPSPSQNANRNSLPFKSTRNSVKTLAGQKIISQQNPPSPLHQICSETKLARPGLSYLGAGRLDLVKHVAAAAGFESCNQRHASRIKSSASRFSGLSAGTNLQGPRTSFGEVIPVRKPIFFTKVLFTVIATAALICAPRPAFAQRGGGSHGGGGEGGGSHSSGGGFSGSGGRSYSGGGYSAGRSYSAPSYSAPSRSYSAPSRGTPYASRGGSYSSGAYRGAPSPYANRGAYPSRPSGNSAYAGRTAANSARGAVQPSSVSRSAVADGKWHSFGDARSTGAARPAVPSVNSNRAPATTARPSAPTPARSAPSTPSVAMRSPAVNSAAHVTPAASALSSQHALSNMEGSRFGNHGLTNSLLAGSRPGVKTSPFGNSSLARPTIGRATTIAVGRPIFFPGRFNRFNNNFFFFPGFGFGFPGFGFGFGFGYSPFWNPFWSPFWYSPFWAPIGYSSYPPAYNLNYGPPPPPPSEGPSSYNDNSRDNNSNATVAEAPADANENPTTANVAESTPTILLYMKDGSMYTASDYWVTGNKLHYMVNYAGENAVDLDQVDMQRTVDENAKRNVRFVLKPNSNSTEAPMNTADPQGAGQNNAAPPAAAPAPPPAPVPQLETASQT